MRTGTRRDPPFFDQSCRYGNPSFNLNNYIKRPFGLELLAPRADTVRKPIKSKRYKQFAQFKLSSNTNFLPGRKLSQVLSDNGNPVL
jgi:hypothetical protein